ITIEECVIYYITGEGEGIMMYAPITATNTNSSINNVYILNNMIIMNRRSGIVAAGQISNTVIEGNSVYHNGWYPIDFDVANTSSKPASEYGNGIVLMKCFDQADNSTRQSIDLTGNSVFDNYNTGIYVFGGTNDLYITYNTDLWGNKDGLVFNGDPADPTHPYDHSAGSEDYSFSNINISDLLIHSNQRFGIYYNTPDNSNPIVAEYTYFEEPPEVYGWGGPETSLGPKMAWGNFNKDADTYYEQNAEKDGGRDYVNVNSWYYDPSDQNNYMTLPSIVYGPVDANPYRKSLPNIESNNFVVNLDQTDSYFDNLNNIASTTPAGTVEEIIYIYPSSTPYTNTEFSFARPVRVIGVDDENGNKPVLKYTTNNGNYIPALVSTSTANIILENVKLVCRDQNGDLLGKIANSSATGNITLKKVDYFKENVSMNNYTWTQLSQYFYDNIDANDGRGLFVKADLMPDDTTGCALWLRGSSITNKEDGNTVELWEDNSSYEIDFEQGVNNYRPTYLSNFANYQPGLNSTGNKYLFVNPDTNPLEKNSSKSVFMVFKTPSQFPSQPQILFEVGNLSCGYSIGIMMINSSPKLVYTLWRINSSSTTFLELSQSLQTETVYFARFWYDENSTQKNFKGYLNGVQVDTGKTFAGFQFSNSSDYGKSVIFAADTSRIKGITRNGLGNYFTGQIAEILVYNNYNENQWNSTVSYFIDKYGFDQGWPRTSVLPGEPAPDEYYEGTGESVSVYPNPFISNANITVAVPETQNVKVEVFDALGRLVNTLFDGVMSAKNYYDFNFNGNNLQSGIYLVKVTGLDFIRTEKIILNK
ncbi:MAG: T9SS type A sorting domain-containing protein, partial [Candidatus Kapabacteria bacterium]|nr:T9SS type A sorting domain-containing protein [Candidatus Kapabacteria bacterium]